MIRKEKSGSINNSEFQQLFDCHNAIMIILDPETGKVETVNRAAEKFYGIKQENFTGKHIKEISSSGQEDIEQLIKGGTKIQIQNHLRADGSIMPVEIHISKIVLGHKKHTFLIIHNISERQKTEHLLAYRQRYEQLIASLSTYFIRPDHHEIEQAIQHPLQLVAEFMESELCMLILLSEDQSTLTISHLWAQDPKLYSYQNSVHQTEDFPEISTILFRGDHIEIRNTGRIVQKASASEKILKETGIKSLLLVPVVSAGLVIGGIGLATTSKFADWPEDARSLLRMVGEMITNVLARRQSEQALRKSEQKYRKFFEEDLTADFIANTEGSIKFCNPAFIRIFAFETEHRALQSNLKDLDGPDGKFKNALKQLNQGKILKSQEFTLRRCDGETVQVIANIRGIADDQGEIAEILGYLFDITEHKKIEEQFRGAQRMEAIGRLAGGVAHDFNNLLTVINGYSDLLLNDNSMAPEPRNKIEQIKRAGERAASLTGQLLAFSRKQIVKPKVLRLNKVINDIEKMLRRLIGENIEIINILDDALGNIEIDPGQIEQVIINLAVNARDAMPEGGRLTIETGNVFLDEQFSKTHHPLKPGSYVRMVVKDTGTGMPPEIQSHIFEPFFTTKEKGKGTGLGLSTIYGIIKQSQGYIWVESRVGQGTEFSIYFPRIDGVPEGEERSQTDQDLFRGDETILVVEDDPSVRRLTVSFLKELGYQVYTAQDARHALEIFSSEDGKIDLSVIDVIMPDMSGKVLSDKLLKQCPDTKILFISGYTDAEIVHYGVLNSGIEFLQKPFNAVNLGKKVRHILDSRSV